MPCSNPRDTKEKRYEATRKRWEEAGKGTGGLRSVRTYDFIDLPSRRRVEVLTEPTILTSDGVEDCVVMRLDDYFARVMPTRGNGRQAQVCHIKGRLFREVI